jgi:uncharacterized protein YdhG (YjbR/CyaY superfamily)
MKSLKKSTPARDIDAYLARVPPQPRATLQKLRRIIKATAPKATETISYQIPTFKYHGMLVSFAAFKDHCSFFPGAVIKDYKDDLKSYETSKGTIRFPADKPLPTALVKKIVKARIKQNEARQELRKSPRAS